jgi:ribokinase
MKTNMAGKIIVAGSINMDMVVKTSFIPHPGQTVLGGTFFMNPGGKGANQAIAVARLGGTVGFIGKIGNDIFGKQTFLSFVEEGVDTYGVTTDHSVPSGVALITVEESGENCIVVAPGANGLLSSEDIASAFETYTDCKIMLIQLEIPMETVAFAASYAQSRGIKVILNPAPANEQVKDIFHLTDIITPNRDEAELLSGVKIDDLGSAKLAAETIKALGAKTVVITLGSEGAVLLQDDNFSYIPAIKVEAIDTTAAGDVFNGALAVAIAEGKDLTMAISFACGAAGKAVTKLGAQASIPFRRDL